jgi:hypothetical protein
MGTLEGKKVLLFAANAFGYERDIQIKMQEMGAAVDYYDERPSNSFLTKVLIRINRYLLSWKIKKYYSTICFKEANKNYDYIVFIKSESVSVKILQRLRVEHPNAKMILYLWDSILNNKNALINYPYFDKVLSFDKNDVARYGFIFRPLFYTDVFKEIESCRNFIYDALFVGTVHSDRYYYVKEIERQIKNMGKKILIYFFFRSSILYYKKKLFDKTYKYGKKEDFHFTPLSKKELIELVVQSKCLVDAQHPKQTGLTIRTIEALGACRKLITTNENIKEYDFYNKDNILIVDRFTPIIRKNFFDEEYIKLDKAVYDNYSLESWIKDLLCC